MNFQRKRSIYALLVPCFLILIMNVSCGRRGDPVLVDPREERPVERTAAGDETSKPPVEEAPAVDETGLPDAPSGLVAVYTGSSVVLAWDDVQGGGIERYGIYRSDGSGYARIGQSVTPAYTDRDVEPDREYYYRITAAGVREGPASEEIKVITRDSER